jgi:hypothetical protein
MKRHIALLLAAVVFAAGELLALPAVADTPMSPVYPTASRPKRVPPPAQPSSAVAAPAAASEKPAPAATPGSVKEAAVTPAKDAAAGPVFEAAIPPPVAAAVAPESPQAPPPAAAPSLPVQKTVAKPRQRRPAPAPHYVYKPYPVYPVRQNWSTNYADQRGWGGGRYGPSPISDGQ